jgi:hypothetical protein
LSNHQRTKHPKAKAEEDESAWNGLCLSILFHLEYWLKYLSISWLDG